jgi:hypothetical protein
MRKKTNRKFKSCGDYSKEEIRKVDKLIEQVINKKAKKTEGKVMKTYLARFTILDGEHEHPAYGLIKAKNLEEAIKYAESQEHTAWEVEDGEITKYFDDGDGQTASNCEHVQELTQEQIDVIGELGLAYYMN